MKEEKLYVVVPYFNHTNAAINRTNFELCLRNLRAYTHIRVIVAEGIWNREAELPNFGDLVYNHLKFELTSPIWVKENLINLGIQSLNNDWEYVCWLDKDIHFLNPNWDIETINKLKEYDIIQPWSRVQFLNKSFEIDMLRSNEKSSVFIQSFYQCPDKEKDKGFLSYGKASQLGYGRSGHPGHTWATNRNFYEKIGGLFDRCIVGGADSFMVVAMDETFDVPHLAIKELYKDFFQKYVNTTRGTKVVYIVGTIIHYFHGEISNRNYYGRFNILSNIDLEKDLDYSDNGTLRINNPKIEKNILDYFYSRKEHTV